MLGLGMVILKTRGCPHHCHSELEQTRQEKEFGLDLLFSTTLSFSYGLPSLKIAHGLNGESHVVIWHLHAVSQKHTSVYRYFSLFIPSKGKLETADNSLT